MSHELRTPLNAIIGFTEMLNDERFGQLNETQQEYLHDVLQSSNHLLAVINGRTFMVKEKAAKHDLHISVDAGGSLETLVADERKISVFRI